MLDLRAEAATYRILRRIAPVLRHEIAGLMQPVRMLLTVIERRMLKPDIDRQAISENISTVGGLASQASKGCLGALDWLVSPSDSLVSLKSSVDELGKLLALEFSERTLTLVNAIDDDELMVKQSVVRTVLIGAMLAFCDEQAAPGKLHISFDKQLHLSVELNTEGGIKFVDKACHDLYIDWLDVEAIAASANISIIRGNHWLRIIISKEH
jgi:hypothetical protein